MLLNEPLSEDNFTDYIERSPNHFHYEIEHKKWKDLYEKFLSHKTWGSDFGWNKIKKDEVGSHKEG